MGGDGLLSECLHGLLLREDGRSLLKRLPLIPLPGGSGNGLSASALHESGFCLKKTARQVGLKPRIKNNKISFALSSLLTIV
jgi:hypothetical protein